METLMKNLQEQHKLQLLEEQLQQTNGLNKMEKFNEKELQLPSRRKYVSIFRIEGAPILPPLMTTEKRKEMQKIKEKALKIEQRLKEHKQRLNKENKEYGHDVLSETSRSSPPNTTGNVSQRSQDYFANKLKESEESMLLLQNLLKKQHPGNEIENVPKVDCGSNTTAASIHMDENQEKLKKLKKSEILIYDNSTKEIIQVPPDKEQQKTLTDNELHNKADGICLIAKKPSHLLFAGVEGMASIPSICLNPPTPLVANRSIGENLQNSNSNNPLITESFNNSFNLTEDSSDDSCISMLTHSNGRSSSSRYSTSKHSLKGLTQVTELVRIKKPYKKTTNVSNKIKQFEDLSSESNTPKTSPEKSPRITKPYVIARSATSPSIKLSSKEESSSARSENLQQDSAKSSEITLIRSSSFTLEGPSKVLIDHMRQQRTINEAKGIGESPLNSTRTSTRKPITTQLRAHRDTVESKAKKVYKVDLKSSKQKLQQKSSQNKLAQAAVASFSFYNSSSLNHKSNNLIKTKKSPYDTSKYNSQPLQKSTASSSHLRKSASTPSSSIALNKTTKTRISNSPMQTPTTSKPNLVKTKIGNENLSQMDKIQNDKFLRLLALQEEEHRRLQQSFEMQQKMLLEQLNREMNNIQLQSPTKNLHSLMQKRPEYIQNNQIANKLQNQFKLGESKSDKPGPSYVMTQQHSPTISNDSFNISITNSQSHSAQSPSLISPNTSLELSTLTNHTSPDTPTTPTNKSTCANLSGNKSSSRRRLFTGDITTTMGNDSTQLSTSRSSVQRSAETTEPGMTLSHNGSIRRQLHGQNEFVRHAAATKINACARGFLVRRLFQTEQIQRIVQTIRDTLIFVINLHLETLENYEESNTPANIKLKARLLQQLSSACRTLHLVFFQTTIKERMEIIARDRKRIKTKLLAMNRKRTPRIAG